MVTLESEPFKILENHDGQGLECWRLFHRRWNFTTPMSSIEVTEAIRKIERATTADGIQPKIQDHMKLVNDWEHLRSLPGSPVKYLDIDLKADYMRIVPEKWVAKLRLDSYGSDIRYEHCTS